jgi:acyl-CoA synthetase (AMP-forming)/AMP-acid ligase II
MVTHPDLAHVAVVGIPDERMGEVGVAFVVARSGHRVDPDEVIAWCRERMANFKVPRRVEVVAEFPVNPSGKVMKFVLRDRAAARR